MDVLIPLVGGLVYLGVYAAGHLPLFERQSKDERLRALARQPRVPLAEAKEGAVQKVAGELRLVGQPLVAPLSGRECAYYEVAIDEVEGVDTQQKCWVNRYFDWGAVDFEIEDETGRARVSQPVPSVVLDIDVEAKRRVFRDVPPELTALLERMKAGGEPPPVHDLRRARVREGVLAPGELITVSGLCCFEVDREGGGYRETARELVLREPPNGEMLITDKRC